MLQLTFHQMNTSSHDSDEEQDSLFGSPPPSPARGRSPVQETSSAGVEVNPVVSVPSTGVGRNNVGTIALPGSHMSCAELPADLPASSLSLPQRNPSDDCLGTALHSISGTPSLVYPPVAASRSSTCSVTSRASSITSITPSASGPTRKRRIPKMKSPTSASPAPPIVLPGPNEPTPPNFLRSQSSLLGLAGLVGSVKPAQLYTHGSTPPPLQPSRPLTPTRGSTSAHPIVIDDDQDALRIGKRSRSQSLKLQHLDQLDPEALRSNITNSLAKEKNIFPVLESLIKLFGGEPHIPPADPPGQNFARPYGHGIFSVPSPSAPSASTTPVAPSLKRRKLKHVPAGAADWDIPFPFAAGEGPEAYRDTWAQDRAKQLVTQLLELVRGATKRAAIKTAKSATRAADEQAAVQQSQSSVGVSLETQIKRASPTQTKVDEFPCPDTNPEGTTSGTPSSITPMEDMSRFFGAFETANVISSPASGTNDRMSADSEVAVEDGGSAVPCDYSAFEEWLSQLQQFIPHETTRPISEPDWGISLEESSSTPAPNTLDPMECDASTTAHAIPDEAIDPALLAISQVAGSASQPPSPTCPSFATSDIPQTLDLPPALSHSPRTSLSSPIEPLTPPSDVTADAPTSALAHQDLVPDPPTQPAEKDDSQPTNGTFSPSPTESSELPSLTASQKGKGRAEDDVASGSAPKSASTGTIDKQAILERARERRKQLAAEIERAKLEIWEMSIENAMLVHLMKDGS